MCCAQYRPEVHEAGSINISLFFGLSLKHLFQLGITIICFVNKLQHLVQMLNIGVDEILRSNTLMSFNLNTFHHPCLNKKGVRIEAK